ncbi:cell surface protein [Periweissella cryptocerci]|uniref:Cell surface protein n=1 Tax=Periweissella cryptocerci TaxID=2506420 RepID=A0A4P6YSQ1_9LACO|nr:CdaR family protein [Periweissella cryptocerci]QBO35653.1 cell surface protein [Periweissella cryptocerci]
MKFANFLKTRGLYMILSLLFAIALFSYVADSNLGNQQNKEQQRMEQGDTLRSLSPQKKVKVTMPLQLRVDTLKYFVTGAPDSVTIELRGPSALVTAAANTKNFEVLANLQNLSLGDHVVSLKTRGLNKEITASVLPAKIEINLAQRDTQNYNVHVQYNEDNVADGYEASQPTTSVQNVQVTGAQDEVNKVDRVVAQLDLDPNTKKDVHQHVRIQALDKQGNLVNVMITPQTTEVNLVVKSGDGQKTVPVDLTATGKDAKKFELTANVNEVTVYGDQATLDQLKHIAVAIDVTGVKKTKTKSVNIDKVDGVSHFSPSSVKVTIKPRDGAAPAETEKQKSDAKQDPADGASAVSSSATSSSSTK